MSDATHHTDVIIIGAGLSGICAAYHLQTKCPNKRFTLLEGRARLGGTWDLFRYPGIRSDSDMHTLGFSFHPWKNPKAIADGPAILSYLHETAETYGIDKKIEYGKRVERARWSSADSRWTVDVRDVATDTVVTYTCNFLFFCSGYYDYDHGHAPEIPGVEGYTGRVVHPQHWPEDLVYEGKRVVIIGSGATAVTLVPAMAKTAAHVTMLQRSPSYVFSMPEEDAVANWLRDHLPAQTAHDITRWKNVLLSMAMYAWCRKQPARARRFLLRMVRKAMPDVPDVETHFSPKYNPWDQRLCLVPDGDLFKVINAGKASVVTDHIESYTATGLKLRSGKTLDADIVVTATGLTLKFLGGVALELNGAPVDLPNALIYKGMMCSDVPNLALAVGYTNASWTLRADLTCEYVCRLLQHMDAHGFTCCTARRDAAAVDEEPLLNLTSGYVQRAASRFPKQGSRTPWRVHQNYAMDLLGQRYSRVDDSVMEFSRG